MVVSAVSLQWLPRMEMPLTMAFSRSSQRFSSIARQSNTNMDIEAQLDIVATLTCTDIPT
jgi:hypothetical protein